MKNKKKQNIIKGVVVSLLLVAVIAYFQSDYTVVLGSTPIVEEASAPGASQPAAPTVVESNTPAPVAAQTPVSGTSSSEVSAESSEATQEVPKEVYVVKEGQTLWEIAQDTGESLQTLMNDNQLRSSIVVEGQGLAFEK